MSLKSMGPSRAGKACRNRDRRFHHISENKIEVKLRAKKKLVKKSEYAKIKGWSPSYVSKLCSKGLIVESDGLINVVATDKRIKEAQDPAREPFKKEVKAKAKAKATTSKKDTQTGKDTQDLSYAQARTERERIKAKKEKVEYDMLMCKLVDSEEVRISAFNRARILRDVMFNIPDRISTILAAESNPRKVHQILFKEIRIVLEEQSNAKC